MLRGVKGLCFAVIAAAIVNASQIDRANAAANCPAGFPGKPIRVTVGFAAGAGTDAIARGISERIAEQQKWTVVVENRPGNGGGTMLVQLKAQAADGYQLGVASTDAVSFNPAAAAVGYAHEDFDYLGSAMQLWVGLVALKTKPFHDLPSFLDYAKKSGRATISTGGPNQELMVRQLNEQYGTNIVAIPGTGAAEAMTAALGGHVDASMQATLHIAHIKSGNMNQLASLIDRRVPYAPDSKTLGEYGATAAPLELFTIFVAPKGLSPALKTCLGEALASAVASAEFKTLTEKIDNEPVNLGEARLKEMVASRSNYYRGVLKK
jgi:tripartite-type tricarboxylate transporter receptor subunit TctC